jgi:colanic acid/amylovoran biosynthesis glycosyltransferase
MKNKELVLLTNGFPFGHGEQFLETEIKILANKFKKIYLFPIAHEDSERPLPTNVEIIMLQRGKQFSSKKIVLKNLILIFRVLFSTFPKRKLYNQKGYKFHFNNLLSYLNEAQEFTALIEAKGLKDVKIYSYWFGLWGHILSFANVISKGKIKFVTRVHGYDYDVNRREDKLLPFRDFHMKCVDAIYPVSNFGVDRINYEYPKFKKAKLEYLGVSDWGENNLKESKQIQIVSCSSLIALKRVHLIAEIISCSNQAILWTHFGDGPLFDQVIEGLKTLPSNINFVFKGLVKNVEILEFYKSNSVNLFVNVSEFEGIPVSIMEAISFGIPVVGCNICGVPEIVTAETGLLLDKDFSPPEAWTQINDFLNMDSNEMIEFRIGVKDFWINHFNAETNYTKFIKENLT